MAPNDAAKPQFELGIWSSEPEAVEPAIPNANWPPGQPSDANGTPDPSVPCPRCATPAVLRGGYALTTSGATVRVYRCPACTRRFWDPPSSGLGFVGYLLYRDVRDLVEPPTSSLNRRLVPTSRIAVLPDPDRFVNADPSAIEPYWVSAEALALTFAPDPPDPYYMSRYHPTPDQNPEVAP